MVGKVIPWSYSSLTSYENCPHRFCEERITRTTPRKQYKEADDGDRDHKAIELYCKGEGPLTNISHRKLVDKTVGERNKEFMFFEKELAITKDRKPCDYNDKENAYYRCKIDFLYVDPSDPTAMVNDWKTGKVNEYSEQLVSNAMAVFAHYPHVQTVVTNYVWLKYGKDTPGKVFRDFSDKQWLRFINRVNRMEVSLEKNDWPKRPSGLCKKYCPVVTCEHNGEFKGV